MTEWYYHSEAELVDILKIATDNLTFRGFHYFQGTEEQLEMHLSFSFKTLTRSSSLTLSLTNLTLLLDKTLPSTIYISP